MHLVKGSKENGFQRSVVDVQRAMVGWLEFNEKGVVGFVWARGGMQGTELAAAWVSDGWAAGESKGFAQPNGNKELPVHSVLAKQMVSQAPSVVVQ